MDLPITRGLLNDFHFFQTVKERRDIPSSFLLRYIVRLQNRLADGCFIIGLGQQIPNKGPQLIEDKQPLAS